MNYETLLYEVDGGVATITLNRPDRLNAFNETMRHELLDLFDRIDADDEVRAVIMTGSGRGFCAGADLGSGGDTFDAGARGRPVDEVNRDGGGTVSLRIFALTKPIIAAVNGPALCTVSGSEAAVDELERDLAGEHVECRRLRTSHAFHSALMDAAVGPFVEAVGAVRLGVPAVPFVSNVTGDWARAATNLVQCQPCDYHPAKNKKDDLDDVCQCDRFQATIKAICGSKNTKYHKAVSLIDACDRFHRKSRAEVVACIL